MTIFKSQKITDLEHRVNELETENLDLKGQLENAKKTAETDQAVALTDANETIKTLTEANEEIPSLNASIAELQGKVTTLEAASVVTAEKVSIRAAELLATQGHPAPVSLAGDAREEEDKSIKNLTGFAKVSASFAAKQSK